MIAQLTVALPTFFTTQARIAVLPLMTVTLEGVEKSMWGRGTGSSVVDQPLKWNPLPATPIPAPALASSTDRPGW